MSHDVSRFDFGATRWSLVFEGQHDGAAGDRARNELLLRYHGAINRFLLTRLGDPHAVDEVYEIYVERVKENHPFLQRADREKGHFRHYLRRVLQNMIIDYYRKSKKKGDAQPFAAFEDDAFVAPPMNDAEAEQFRQEWVMELMSHAWRALEAESQAKNKPYFDLMLHKAKNPNARARDISEHFRKLWKKPLSEVNVRQILHRGQELLSDLFLQEVARSLENHLDSSASADQIEAELIELKMLDDPRRAALARFRAMK